MASVVFSSKIKFDTLISKVASAMLDMQSEYVLDLESLEVIETTNDMRYSADRIVLDENNLDLFPEWVQESPNMMFMTDHEPDKFIHIPRISKAEMLRLKTSFANSIHDVKVAKALKESLQKSRPLSAFRHELSFHTGFRTRWIDFRQGYGRKMALKWLKKMKIEVK